MTGRQMEEIFIDGLMEQLDVTDTTGTREYDYEQGTDCILHGEKGDDYRIDITWDAVDKSGELTFLGDAYIHANSLGLQINYYIRTDNGHSEFQKPVLVVELQDTSSYLERGYDWAITALKEVALEIVEGGCKVFNEYIVTEDSIKEDPLCITEKTYQTTDMKNIAIDNITPEQAPDLAKGLTEPTPRQQDMLVSMNGFSIEAFPNASEKLQMKAVEQNPEAVRVIASPSEAVQARAVELNPKVVALMEHPSPAVQELAVSLNPDITITNSAKNHVSITEQFENGCSVTESYRGGELDVREYRDEDGNMTRSEYYEDGRIDSIDYFDEKEELQKTEYYDENGNLIDTYYPEFDLHIEGSGNPDDIGKYMEESEEDETSEEEVRNDIASLPVEITEDPVTADDTDKTDTGITNDGDDDIAK